MPGVLHKCLDEAWLGPQSELDLPATVLFWLAKYWPLSCEVVANSAAQVFEHTSNKACLYWKQANLPTLKSPTEQQSIAMSRSACSSSSCEAECCACWD